MGTDYDEFRKTCPCGQGMIRVGCSSPDHSWPSTYSIHWDASIECETCQQTYMVDGNDSNLSIVRRADVIAVAARRKAYEHACAQFMASPSVATLKSAFADHLDSLPSVAAIYRYLDSNRMAGSAIGTFRKNWRDGPNWANGHVGIWNVAKIANLLGRDPTVYDAALADLERLQAAVGSVRTIMGGITKRSAHLP